MCSGSAEERKNMVLLAERVSEVYIIPPVIFSLTIVSIMTTVYLFVGKSAKERPTFVTLQMVLLLISNVFFSLVGTIYIIDEVRGTDDELTTPKATVQLLLSLADVFYIMHDWLLTEQLMMMSLTLPIATNFYKANDLETLNKSRESAKKIRIITNIIIYSLIIIWFTGSLVTNLFIWRMGISFVIAYQIGIFVVSLMSLRNIIGRLVNKEQFKINSWSLYTLLISSAITFAFCFALFTVSIFSHRLDDIEEITESECKIQVTQYVIYTGFFVSVLSRSAITCYTNIKFTMNR